MIIDGGGSDFMDSRRGVDGRAGAGAGAGAGDGAEVQPLLRRVAELELALAEATRREREAQLKILAHEAILEVTPAIVFLKDRSHRYLYINQAYADRFGVTREAILGKTDAEIFPSEMAKAYRESDEMIMASGVAREGVELRGERADGKEIWTLESSVPYRDERGEVVGMAGVALDVTERKRGELSLRQREAQLEEMVQQKERLLETIAALSAPVLPVEDGVLVLPLVGHVDVARADRLLEVLLDCVQRQRATFVILDLTGVPAVDAPVAERLVRAARAVGLLGARVAVTGVSPKIARELMDLGVDLSNLAFCGDLRVGIRHALGHAERSRRRPPAPR